MAQTTSIRFPNMFDAARNTVNVVEDKESVVNRTRLLMLTEPTELYNEPNFGVGLKRYLWQYNTPTVKGIVQDRIKNQLNLWEPCVYSEQTEFADGLLFTEGQSSASTASFNDLKMTVKVSTVFGDEAEITIENEQQQ